MKMGARRAFSLVELLVVVAIIAVLAALSMAALNRIRKMGDVADSTAHLRTVGQAILLYSSEHNDQLPGPLWPGQVMLYDSARDGRIVRDLADYLGVEQKTNVYLVTKMIPRAFTRVMQGSQMENVRVYVMNSSVLIGGETNQPFGSLTPTTNSKTMKVASFQDAPTDERWLVSETDQTHPDVSGAPWKLNTPPLPLYDNRRMVLKATGGVELQATTNSP